MPRLRPLVSPRLAESLTPSFFTRRVTIQTTTGTARSASGYKAPAPAALVAHEHLAAAIQPLDERGRAEMRGEQMTVAQSTHYILFPAYYPAITPAMRVVDDELGTIYDITRADTDGDHVLTRLLCRQVSPVAVEGV